ncbi:MAG: methylenetetrahydrofolate--tRNA-(uracil(54)-C(5))-methyltransferase (FADH(2)-oxidizing) TrmFO [Oscillospiraceae bacterium]|nr:methylenetetrahydrofolate--tRNA-(uracil(54)-C(5))-methyltransferase (FADH(2)-oxidizing) TrmFO [Oscillospiraceae bacterium]
MEPVSVIGAGLAGCEAAWQLAVRGVPVRLYEMKPERMSPAHTSPLFAELVCSNSLRGDDLSNAVGLLKEELRRMGSLIMLSAEQHRVPAGGALAVDRTAFAQTITDMIRSNPNIQVIEGERTDFPVGECIVATGPLTSNGLIPAIGEKCGSKDFLHFYDAAAPLIAAESIDMKKAWFGSRYGKGTADYINCPMNKEEYIAFTEALASAKQAEVHGFEDGGVFEGCMPVEVMARRGQDTLRYGPLKPVGLRHPETGESFYAVVQLRRDNQEGTVYNLVGFQTHLTFPEQRRVFGMIPALAEAEYLRYGKMHRNTFLNSPALLDRYYRLRSEPRLSFAGQITGVEGYVESCASGLLVGIETARRLTGLEPLDLPRTTATGALALYVSGGGASGDFQPMNINFGIIEPYGERIRGKRERNLKIAERALAALDERIGRADFKA